VKGQDASGLSFGGWKQSQPPRIADDIASLIAKGIAVYLVDGDAAERGIERADLIVGLQSVSRSGLPRFFQAFDQIWAW
jgi:hypothetical protein